MEAEQTTPSYSGGQNPNPNPLPPPSGGGKGVKKALGPLAVLGALFAKFWGVILPALKFFPFILKAGPTLLSMLLSVGVYTMFWGWKFAVGFVLLIFVHECGHLVMAKYFGLKVSAPMFIPMFGAVILLRESPRNAWIEAVVGIGGPVFGTVGAVACYAYYMATGNGLFCALAATGFWINLFNLTPIGFLDGGRIVTALSPWLWVVGTVIFLSLMIIQFNIVLLILFIMSLPRLFSLFRNKSPEQARYFEVTPAQRIVMAVAYFGLIAFLFFGMLVSDAQTGGRARGIQQVSNRMQIGG